MSLESKTSTKRDGWALGDAVLVLPTSGWSSHIGSLAIAKELHTMEEMIGKELWGRLRQGNAKATPACLRSDGWGPSRMGSQEAR
jgi:hypothetical protein